MVTADLLHTPYEGNGPIREGNKMRSAHGLSASALPMNQQHGTRLQIVVRPGGFDDVLDALAVSGNHELEQQPRHSKKATQTAACSVNCHAVAVIRISDWHPAGCSATLRVVAASSLT